MVAAAVAGAAGFASAEPLKLRIQYPSLPGHLTPMMPLAPAGVLRHYGKSYVIEAVYMLGSTPALQAMAANELEIASFTPSVLPLAVKEAKLDVRVFAQVITTDYPGYSGAKFWVRKDEIAKIEDLKGKVIAVNAHGSQIDAAQKLVMRRHGLKDGTDYQTIELRLPAMLAALQAKRVNAVYLIRPFDLMAGKDPNLKPLFGMGDAFGPSETGIYAAKTDWIAKNRAVLLDFLEDNIRMRRWAADPKTRMDAVKITAQVMKQPVENLATWAFTTQDTSYREPSARPDVARIQKNIDDMVEAGVLTVALPAKDYVDLTIAEEAAKRVDRGM
jgi:NitT/TauT family transport system substrate-binding protein